MHNHYMTLRYLPCTELFEILSNLDVNKTPGIDGISPAVLKYCASPLLVPLCHLFTCSISSGRIPIQWCTHCIIPIHKSGDKTHIKTFGLFHSCVLYIYRILVLYILFIVYLPYILVSLNLLKIFENLEIYKSCRQF